MLVLVEFLYLISSNGKAKSIDELILDFNFFFIIFNKKYCGILF